jgi:mevalonate kinase
VHRTAMRLYVPYKTFLLGEYAVLHTGQALLLATRPGFDYEVTLGAQEGDWMQTWVLLQKGLGLSEACPVTGLWRQLCQAMAVRVQLLSRSHKGFGSSGALAWLAFICAYRSRHGSYPDKTESFLLESMREYDDLMGAQQGYRPSGGDMICQFMGQVTCMDKVNQLYTTSSWPFSDLGFALIHTGNKVWTQDHLHQVSFTESTFIALYEQAVQAFFACEQAAFVQAFCQYQDNLVAEGLQALHTTQLLASLRSVPGFVAGKGCGALGAEVVCVLYERSCRASFLRDVQRQCAVVATEQDLSSGFFYEPAAERLL